MTIRLVHLSDIHFGCENVEAAEAALAAAGSFAPDLTIISGDLTANGRRDEFVAARAWLDRLPKPQLATPGNHDVPYWNLPLRLFSPFGRYREFVGRPDKTAAYLRGLTVRSLNTARGAQPRFDWSKGAINLASVEAAADGMRIAEKALKILVCHHPLVEMQNAPVTGGVHRGAAAARLIADAEVDLILTGHVHVPFAVPVFSAAGGCYAVGAGTLSLRTRGAPAGFSTIEADAGTIRVTALAWTGTGFEPATVWTLPRGAQPSRLKFLSLVETPDSIFARRQIS